MIDIKKLVEEDKGTTVWYKSFDGFEMGILKSWNDKYIFVVYPAGNYSKIDHYENYTAAATKPEDLFWSKPTPTSNKLERKE